VVVVSVSYKRLWKLLIDQELKKKDLRQLAGISPTTIAKLSKNENVSTEVLVKICRVLKCNIGEIMDVVRDNDA